MKLSDDGSRDSPETMDPAANVRHAPPPPTITLPRQNLSKEEKDAVKCALRAMRAFRGHAKTLDESLAIEMSVAAAFAYRNHNRFRNDRGYRDSVLLKKCLARFRELSVSKAVADLLDAFPLLADVAAAGKVYLPTAEMLSHVLSRVQGAFALATKMAAYCKTGGDSHLSRLHLGHFWGVAMNSLSSTARIWSVTLAYLAILDRSYQTLVTLLPALPSATTRTKPSFVPDLVSTLPGDLAQLVGRVPAMAEQKPGRISNPKSSSAAAVDGDLGEIVERKVPAPAPPCNKQRWRRICDAVDPWSSRDDVAAFAREENARRKTARKDCVSKKLDRRQWKELQAHLSNFASSAGGAKSKKALKNLKERAKAWMVHPELSGKFPDRWKETTAALNQ